MKTKLFFTVLSLLFLTQMQAKVPAKAGDLINFGVDYYDQPIEFVERGIEFYVFLNGDFDFNTVPTTQVDYVYRSSERHIAAPRGIRIERDAQGRIRRIGNVFISYTMHNSVKRIGSVFIDYHQNRMVQVGNLKIKYFRNGVRFVGSVHRPVYHNHTYYSNNWTSFSTPYGWSSFEYNYYDPYFASSDFYNNYESYDEDDNYYYFRTKDTRASNGKIIKRKKVTNVGPNTSRR